MLANLKKFGIKGKMRDWIANCYADVTVKATAEGESVTFSSDTGVKQGDNLSPALFLFVIQAFIELLEDKKVTGEDWPEKTASRTRPDGVPSNRHTKPTMSGEEAKTNKERGKKNTLHRALPPTSGLKSASQRTLVPTPPFSLIGPFPSHPTRHIAPHDPLPLAAAVPARSKRSPSSLLPPPSYRFRSFFDHSQ